ncbi:THUMP domain-containing class I SAM-dependent RNA methyltransferase [Profundibacterium mesophilum]|uniref:Microcin C transport system substrate-binding protein n=1 Tax=Profundibacterium mesophilum KAUST100406-0324 TaxID=1037889 RepID=A0A921NV05_9RHOB|nr:class I SAM-dependent RNA methyltransferase [Profundibacterium mesophilum]KAF0676000.1 microcin C transport system substrate-binding protein [Profundibacterium mesophilum KAUST100406-0324]
MNTPPLEIFLAAPPGLEPQLAQEAAVLGFADPRAVPGGVIVTGDWTQVWRANLALRGAGRVLVRIGSFMAFHLAQLDRRARKFPWGEVLPAGLPVRVEVSCHGSKIYHAGAAAERIETALRESFGATVSPQAALVLKVRIEDNKVTISVDASGEPLHKRGHKEAVGKAPMRETLAALFLRRCGFDGTEPVIDPMCGSGTFVIEAAEIAAGLVPGRSRSFAFERLASFDAERYAALRAGLLSRSAAAPAGPPRFLGFDRDAGAVRASLSNAERAGVGGMVAIAQGPISALERPDGPPGLVMVNPPYGARIGNKKLLYALYGKLGAVLAERFAGWRVGLVTSEPGLAKATGLPFAPLEAPVSFGGLKVRLHRTGPLR